VKTLSFSKNGDRDKVLKRKQDWSDEYRKANIKTSRILTKKRRDEQDIFQKWLFLLFFP